MGAGAAISSSGARSCGACWVLAHTTCYSGFSLDPRSKKRDVLCLKAAADTYTGQTARSGVPPSPRLWGLEALEVAKILRVNPGQPPCWVAVRPAPEWCLCHPVALQRSAQFSHCAAMLCRSRLCVQQVGQLAGWPGHSAAATAKFDRAFDQGDEWHFRVDSHPWSSQVRRTAGWPTLIVPCAAP